MAGIRAPSFSATGSETIMDISSIIGSEPLMFGFNESNATYGITPNLYTFKFFPNGNIEGNFGFNEIPNENFVVFDTLTTEDYYYLWTVQTNVSGLSYGVAGIMPDPIDFQSGGYYQLQLTRLNKDLSAFSQFQASYNLVDSATKTQFVGTVGNYWKWKFGNTDNFLSPYLATITNATGGFMLLENALDGRVCREADSIGIPCKCTTFPNTDCVAESSYLDDAWLLYRQYNLLIDLHCALVIKL